MLLFFRCKQTIACLPSIRANKDLKTMAERSLRDQYELTDENDELQMKLHKAENIIVQ